MSEEMLRFQKLHDINPTVFVHERMDGPRFKMTRDQCLWTPKLGALLTPKEDISYLAALEDYWQKVFSTERVSVVLGGFLGAVKGRGRYPCTHVVDSMELTVTRYQFFCIDVFQSAGFLVEEISQTRFAEEGDVFFTHKINVKLAFNTRLESLLQKIAGIVSTPKSYKFDDMRFANLMENKTFWETSLQKLDSVGSPSLVFTFENIEKPNSSLEEELSFRWLTHTHVTKVQEVLPFLGTAIEVADKIHQNNLWVQYFVKSNEAEATCSALTKLPVENFIADHTGLEETFKIGFFVQYVMEVALEILNAHSQVIEDFNSNYNERWKINDYLEVFDKQPLNVFLELLLKKFHEAGFSISAFDYKFTVNREHIQYPWSALMAMNERI